MASSSILANSKLNLSKSLQLCIRTFRHTSASVPYDMDPAVFPLSARSKTLYGSLKMMTPSQAAKTEMDPLSGNGAAVDAPPAYSSSKKRMVEAPLTTFSCGFEAVTTDPDLYFSKYGRYSSNEQDCTIFLSASGLEDTDWLVATFLAQAKLPPKPMIRLKGTHKSAGTTVVDFNLCFDMTPFFLGDLHHLTLPADIPHNNSRDEVVVLLRRWAKSFQTSSDECKAFVLERTVSNWDTKYLERELRDLVHAAQYAGHLDVSFPIRYARVKLQNVPTKYTVPAPEPQDPTSFRSRLGKCFHRNHPKTAYHTLWNHSGIRTVWPYASGPPEDWGRRPIKQSERGWFEKWSGPIRSAVLLKKSAWITENHYMTFKAGLDNVQQPKYGWGFDVSSRSTPAV